MLKAKRYLFQTQRIGFRNWLDADLDPFAAMNQDPAVMEFFPKTLTREESASMIQRLQKTYQQYGYTFYAVDRLDTGELIGFIGMIYQTFEAMFTPCVEIGWRLKRSAWGHGFATEGAKACLDYGFEELGFTSIYSITPLQNVRSEKVMQRIGMEQIGEFDHPKLEQGHWLERHVIYRIRK